MFPERTETDVLSLTPMFWPLVDIFDLYDLFVEESEAARGVGLWGLKWRIKQLCGEVEFLADDGNVGIVRFGFPDMPPVSVN